MRRFLTRGGARARVSARREAVGAFCERHVSILGKSKFSKKTTLEFLKNRTSDSRGIPRLCGFRDFEDSEISRNLKFLAVPVLCHDKVMQPRKGSWARGARARGRVFGMCFRTSSHARDAPRSLRDKFGKSENLRFRNFGTGSEIWALFALPYP